MISRNETCAAGQILMTFSTCLDQILEEWTGVDYLSKYILYGIICFTVVVTAIVAFLIIPFGILCYIYLAAFFLHVYQWLYELNGHSSSDLWVAAMYIIVTPWDVFGRFWHGYEIHGIENLPEGPGVLYYYHGAIPIDYIFFQSRMYILKQRFCRSVMDNFLYKCPGLKILLDMTTCMQGTKEECLDALKDGHWVGISPGGTREAIFSDETYKLVWHNRKGFVEVALKAKVPIIPMYTQNIREGYKVFGKTGLIRWLYEYTRLPFTIPYGGFPVKLRTYIGEPIPYDPNTTSVELAEKAKTVLQSLIQKHQTIPGSTYKALMERFNKHQKKK
uniref:Phospholipid/glycerol acyltransferase domain-containing protein n=1 Tax=Sphenodon punctatus TaxID=8508 RepID=A0A8D0GPU4_SPHPU